VKGTEDVDAMDILNEVESKLQEQDSDDLVDLDENLTCHFSLDNFDALRIPIARATDNYTIKKKIIRR